MSKNIASIERVVRIIIGLFVVSLLFWGPKTMWGLLGLIPIVTALMNWCPLYSIFGISTRKTSESESSSGSS